jgi:predicted metal-binding membrane protein
VLACRASIPLEAESAELSQPNVGNLAFWVVVITLFVMAEKMLVRGELLAHVTGVALVTAGVAFLGRLL